jgi:putative ABC transport system permease protein
MWRFAWRNLRTRPARTFLAVIGLSIPIFGVLGLLSLSAGVRNLMGNTFGQVPGILVLRENILAPVASDLPASLADRLRRIPGIRVVAPQVWKIAPTIEGRSLFARSAAEMLGGSKLPTRSLIQLTAVEGIDIAEHNRLRNPLFRSRLLPADRGGGRYLSDDDAGQPNIVISTKIAAENPQPDGAPRRVGDSLRIGQQAFRIVGIYATDSLVLDATVIMDIATARRLLNVGADMVSCFLVEPDDPRRIDAIMEAIEREIPDVDARNMSEFNVNVGRILGDLDLFLLLISSLALLVGAIGIVNTMLMSTSERYAEFGILRTNGWTRRNVLALVTVESGTLGLFSGLLGGALALAAELLANQFLGEGIQLAIRPSLLAGGVLLSTALGLLGGLYPAWRASRLTPMEAIRRGGAR